ncbi:ComEC/Rec2 family competence protein [Actinocorallia sp. A-T 12471]|uniref:ComEC/Rec2 family competence protein n=1 Tax=Actinocorallia sp. A-T 12471 TaxID=3089813 RepID=UPI0029D03662|nr:ComEC/Rec2 family competence protein [Actinocorallia sp. A-T 12471]MDX6743481.1 ComEC/Rec2 family competence protein [Actinocorallia sp. A-T 12471]
MRTPVVVMAMVRDGRAEGWEEVKVGERVRGSGRFAVPDGGGLVGAVIMARGPTEVVAEAGGVQKWAEGVRAGLREAVSGLAAEPRGVVPGMVLGDVSGVPQRTHEEFRAAGLVHCLVVSGANFSILTATVLWAGRWAGLGVRGAVVAAGVAAAGFFAVVGAEPSVLRASVTGAIGLFAVFAGRERQGVPTLAGAVTLLVLIDPGLSVSWGFVLSVTATAGLLVLAPRLRDRLRAWGLSARLSEAVAVPLAAQTAVGPVLAAMSGQVGVGAVVANVLAAPGIAVTTVCGFAAAALAQVSADAARWAAAPAGWAASWVIAVADAFAALPYMVMPWPGGFAGAALLVCCTVGAAAAVRVRWVRRLAVAVAAGAVVAAVGVRLVAPAWPPEGWRFVACDVGQGDALVLYAAPGKAVVVDAGPDPGRVAGCLRRLGVRNVPLVVLTHPHADHLAGLPGVLRGRPRTTVAHSPLSALGPERRAASGARASPALLAAERGARWTYGALTLDVLGPGPGPTPPSGDGTAVNNASVVLLARWTGLTVLLAGDLEEAAQNSLRGLVPRVDVLKVPHHGSPRQEPAFLAEGRPAVAVISVGRDNPYGHPSARTLSLLRPARVYRTDLHGDIAITATTPRLQVHTRPHP